MGLPSVVATILLIIGSLVATTTYVACHEGARAGAREAMLQGHTDHAAAVARRAAGANAHVVVTSEGGWVQVRVSKQVVVGLPIKVSAEMTAPIEPGTGPWLGEP